MLFSSSHIYIFISFVKKVVIKKRVLLLFSVDRDTHEIFYRLQSNVFDAASSVCFKPITWYIEMHRVWTFFLCGVMAFSYYVMSIHNVFIFKKKAYRAFFLP